MYFIFELFGKSLDINVYDIEQYFLLRYNICVLCLFVCLYLCNKIAITEYSRIRIFNFCSNKSFFA